MVIDGRKANTLRLRLRMMLSGFQMSKYKSEPVYLLMYQASSTTSNPNKVAML